MQILFNKTSMSILLLFCGIFITALSLSASSGNTSTRYAVIIGARAGSNSLSNDNVEFVGKLRDFLTSPKTLGIKPEHLRVFIDGGAEALSGAAEADLKLITEDFAGLEKDIKANDELWLFLSGYASAAGKRYSLATRHGRLRGAAIKRFLQKVKGQKYVFCFTPVGSVLLSDIREIKNLTAVSATSSSGQNSMPRLPLFFARRAAKGNIFDMIELIDASVKDLKQYYESQSLLQAETAVMLVDSRMVGMPLGSNDRLASGIFPKMGNISYIENKNKLVGDTSKPINLPDSVIIKPADQVTRKLLTDAKAVADKYKQYKAFFPQEMSTVEINRDQSSRLTRYQQIYLLDDIAAEQFSFYRFPKTARIDQVRIIYPDGRFHEPEPRAAGSGRLVRFPNAVKGCLIELKYVLDRKPDTQLNELHGSVPVQHKYPVAKSMVTLELPEKLPVYYKLANGSVKPAITDKSGGKKVTYKFTSVPALELLPYSPPATRIVKRVMFSSYQSWVELAEMIESLARPSRKLDGKTVAFVEKFTAGAESDTEKVQRIYNFLCDLRYQTTVYGVGGLKPRNPALVIKQRFGDCKDKANALVTLAGAVGVEGYFALVNRGQYTDPDFPSWQFNHAMVYFPKLKGYPEGLWCDATDGSTVFGSLPPGDIGRNALLLDGEKSRFRQITLSAGAENFINQIILLTKEKDGSFSGTCALELTGLPDYHLRQKLKRLGPEMKRFLFATMITELIPEADLVSYNIATPLGKLDTSLKLTISFTVSLSPALSPPMMAPPIHKAFTSRKRPLGIVVNDGQPWAIGQCVEVYGDDPELYPKPDDVKIRQKNLSGSCMFKNKPGVWTRSMFVGFRNGFISGEEYGEIRAGLHMLFRAMYGSK